MIKLRKFLGVLFLLILLFSTDSSLNGQAMNDPNLYADSMRNTSEGITLYNIFMNAESEDTSQVFLTNTSENAVWYHYVNQWYLSNPLPGSPQGDDDSTMCYNHNFDEVNQNYNEIDGYEMFDGSNKGLNLLNCDVTEIDFVPLPEMAVPQPPPSNGYIFDLNPNNNSNVDQLINKSAANYHSMELMHDEMDYNLYGIVSPISPTGFRSIRINNDHTAYHVNKLARTFLVESENSIYYFSFSVLMQEPITHPLKDKPFFKAQVLNSNGNIIDEICLVSSVENSQVQIWPGDIPAEPFTYTQWKCDSFDLSEYEEEWVTIEFIASDCVEGAHWGYAYVSNICIPCNEIPSMVLNPIDTSCSQLPVEVCGNLFLPPGYDLQSLTLEIYHDDWRHKILYNPDYDPLTGIFCFTIEASDMAGFPAQGYDVYAVANLINPLSDPTIIRSISANSNSNEINNDFYIGLRDDTCFAVIISNDCKDSTKYYIHITFNPDAINGLFEIDVDNIVGNFGGSNFAVEVISYDSITGSILLSVAPNSVPDSCPYALTLTIPYMEEGEFVVTKEVCPEQCFALGDFVPEITVCYDSSDTITICGEYIPPGTETGVLDLRNVLVSYRNTSLDIYGFFEVDFDIQNNKLCLIGDFPQIEGCFDLQLKLTYEGDNGDYFFIVGDFTNGDNNDICLNPNGCCPDSLFLVWIADLNNIKCLDAGSSGEEIIEMEFVLYLPDDFVDCGNAPIFEDGYFEYSTYNYSSLTNSIHIKGEYHITDILGFSNDFTIRGDINLCMVGDTSILCPATFEIAKIDCHTNCSEDPCSGGVECNAFIDVTYVHGGTTYMTLCVNLIEPQGECEFDDYQIYIYDDYGAILSHPVSGGRVDANGLYCVEFEYETELEEFCLDIRILNECTDLYYCESTICVENEPLWGGGSISNRSSNSLETYFNVIPNPVSSGTITIVSENPAPDQITVILYGLDGKVIIGESKIDLIAGKGIFEIGEISSGYYHLQISSLNFKDKMQYTPVIIIK